mmetsp:Transcript_17694/g.26212  ORF Transcript_17694/g.26212 Transcript_17694/m.26212 type:complete len:246 (-) Transcript_17694:364-1101(-)
MISCIFINVETFEAFPRSTEIIFSIDPSSNLPSNRSVRFLITSDSIFDPMEVLSESKSSKRRDRKEKLICFICSDPIPAKLNKSSVEIVSSVFLKISKADKIELSDRELPSLLIDPFDILRPKLLSRHRNSDWSDRLSLDFSSFKASFSFMTESCSCSFCLLASDSRPMLALILASTPTFASMAMILASNSTVKGFPKSMLTSDASELAKLRRERRAIFALAVLPREASKVPKSPSSSLVWSSSS